VCPLGDTETMLIAMPLPDVGDCSADLIPCTYLGSYPRCHCHNSTYATYVPTGCLPGVGTLASSPCKTIRLPEYSPHVLLRRDVEFDLVHQSLIHNRGIAAADTSFIMVPSIRQEPTAGSLRGLGERPSPVIAAGARRSAISHSFTRPP
jgi:hypothetical protein